MLFEACEWQQFRRRVSRRAGAADILEGSPDTGFVYTFDGPIRGKVRVTCELRPGVFAVPVLLLRCFMAYVAITTERIRDLSRC